MPAPIGTRDAEPSHKLGERAAQHNFTASRPYRFGRDPRQDQARVGTVGQLVKPCPTQDQPVRTIHPLILILVAGGASGQGTQRHRSRHKAQIGVRFASPDKLVHLIGKGEAPPRRWWGFAERRHVIQAGDNFTDRNQLTALTLHGFSFSHVPQTRQGHHFQTNAKPLYWTLTSNRIPTTVGAFSVSINARSNNRLVDLAGILLNTFPA